MAGSNFLEFVTFAIATNATILITKWLSNKFGPIKVTYIGKVEKLIVYPVKSCPGIEYEKVFCSETGLISSPGHLKDR